MQLFVLEAAELRKADTFSKSDPYCKISGQYWLRCGFLPTYIFPKFFDCFCSVLQRKNTLSVIDFLQVFAFIYALDCPASCRDVVVIHVNFCDC